MSTPYTIVENWAVKQFGADVALVLSKALYWHEYVTRAEANPLDGHFWLRHTAAQWVEDLEEMLTVDSVRRALTKLKNEKILVVRHEQGFAPLYRVDFGRVSAERARAVPIEPTTYTDAQKKGDATDRAEAANPPDDGGGAAAGATPDPSGKCEAPSQICEAPLQKPETPSQICEGSLPLGNRSRKNQRRHSPDADGAGSERKRTAPPKPPSTEGGKVWVAYERAYLARWGVVPPRDRTANSICKQLAERWGGDAPDVVEFYVNHPRADFVKAQHPLEFLASAFGKNAVYGDWKRGRVETTQAAQQGERRVERASQVQRVVASMEADDQRRARLRAAGEEDLPW